jgi:hypothetical protein
VNNSISKTLIINRLNPAILQSCNRAGRKKERKKEGKKEIAFDQTITITITMAISAMQSKAKHQSTKVSSGRTIVWCISCSSNSSDSPKNDQMKALK